jgi:hypothetical protein
VGDRRGLCVATGVVHASLTWSAATQTGTGGASWREQRPWRRSALGLPPSQALGTALRGARRGLLGNARRGPRPPASREQVGPPTPSSGGPGARHRPQRGPEWVAWTGWRAWPAHGGQTRHGRGRIRLSTWGAAQASARPEPPLRRSARQAPSTDAWRRGHPRQLAGPGVDTAGSALWWALGSMGPQPAVTTASTSGMSPAPSCCSWAMAAPWVLPGSGGQETP